jgi:hypothetical protein
LYEPSKVETTVLPDGLPGLVLSLYMANAVSLRSAVAAPTGRSWNGR